MTTIQEPSAVSKFDLYCRGMHALHNVLGTVDAEEFISLVKSDRFDYTEWQRQHFDQKTPEQISAEAEAYVIEHPYAGDPSTIIQIMESVSQPSKRTLGIANGKYNIPDNIDVCNDEIAEMFEVNEHSGSVNKMSTKVSEKSGTRWNVQKKYTIYGERRMWWTENIVDSIELE